MWAVTNADGQAVVLYFYDAWGNVAKRYVADGYDAIAQINPILYRSYYCDLELGFYYLNTRYYVPALHRFLNSDSLVDNRGLITQNLFQYCGNNPVNFADSNGNLFGAILLVGALAVGMLILSGCDNTSAPVSAPSTTTPSTPSTTISTTAAQPSAPNHAQKSYAATVYAEAGGQNRQTKRAVAHVMNNRIGSRKNWSSIEAVISAPNQFDGYNSVMFAEAMEYYNTGICANSLEQAAMDECLEVVIPIYYGEDPDITDGALYFHSFPNASDWKYHDDYTQVYVEGTEGFWFYK